ncbi:MAG: hypothetical protein KA250_02295 [Verrucomicrobiales bacterium]|jgi:hypothetical protein|nr:hypothetical protein [Verrucomicrobiales bacterium]
MKPCDRSLFLVILSMGFALFPAKSEAESESGFRLATFSADVTPPLGHTLFTGRWKPAEAIESPLEARGWVLLPPGKSGEKPIVCCVVDWSEIRNDAYDRWRDALAEAAGTTRERTFVSTIHQHDTPLADLEAQRILEAAGSKHQVIDLEFHEKIVVRVATALRESLASAEKITHLGTGRGRVEQIASNRRYQLADGTVRYNRMSSTHDLSARRAPEGEIDPFVSALSFWNADHAIAVLSVYATHPMSYYGNGIVGSDFPGIARAARQTAAPGTFQIYASGCSGNVTAGKFNDGSPENRPILAKRLEEGMAAALAATKRVPLSSMEFRLERVRLEPRESRGFSVAELQAVIASDGDARAHGMAALGLSWRARADDPAYDIDLPALKLNDGSVNLLLLPGEIYVEYQLAAQAMAPDAFVMTLGYGESAPGYLPIERAWAENDSNLGDWCWVAPGMEERMKAAIRSLLQKKATPIP